LNILIPWLAMFAVCFAASFVGTYLQRKARKRRELERKMHQADVVLASVTAAFQPPRQSGGLGNYSVKEQQGSVGRFNQ
jgi:hypothetical protein